MNLSDDIKETADAAALTKKTVNWGVVATISTLIVTLLIPVLYVIGRTYSEKYLSSYGISPALFESSTQDYIYIALYGITLSLLKVYKTALSLWWWLVGLSLVLSLVAFFSMREKYTLKIKKKLLKLIDRPLVKHSSIALFTGFFSVFIQVLVLILFLALIIMVLAIGLKAGESVGKDEIKRDKGVCESKVRKELAACIRVIKDNQEIAIGRIIASSSTHIAIVRNGKATILPKEDLTFEVLPLNR